MKRKNQYKLIVLIVTILIVTTILLLHFLNVYNIKQSWFAILILGLSIILIARAILYHSKSTMWFACVLLLISFVAVIEMGRNIDLRWIGTISTIIVTISGILLYIIYMDKRGLISAFVFAPIIVPCSLYTANIINVWWQIIIIMTWIVVVMLTIKLISKYRIEKVKNGKI